MDKGSMRLAVVLLIVLLISGCGDCDENNAKFHDSYFRSGMYAGILEAKDIVGHEEMERYKARRSEGITSDEKARLEAEIEALAQIYKLLNMKLDEFVNLRGR